MGGLETSLIKGQRLPLGLNQGLTVLDFAV
jgi:hypothetical protein